MDDEPVFGAQAKAEAEALRFANPLRQLPTLLRAGIHRFSVHMGQKGFHAGAGHVIVYSGTAGERASYNHLEESLFHESVHASLDKDHRVSDGWKRAQASDGRFLTSYAARAPEREDLAETALFAFAILHHPDRFPPADTEDAMRAVPHRIAYIKRLFPPGKPLVYSVCMDKHADDLPSRRHSLSDWLALHELDPVACCRILDAVAREAASAPAARNGSLGAYALDAEAAWLRTADAMRAFFSAQQSIIDDTFKKTGKIIVEQRDRSRRALTIDNGPTTYPTILYSYDGEPSDSLVIAHEFGHALQIRASRGKFVPPVIREVCAFIGEKALLSHAAYCDMGQYDRLFQVWHEDNKKYLGTQRDRLKSALLRPEAPYKYFWNYPIARYLAIQISQRCSRDRMWTIFEGDLSVRGVLRELAFDPNSA